MGVSRDELNLQEIFQDLGKVCQTEARCGKCADRGCLVGYSKDCAAQCRVKKQTFVENGFEEIPPVDIRGGYDEYEVLHTISHLLSQCRECKTDHFENCAINVIRSCMEVIEFGDNQEYEGDVLSYMMKIREIAPDKAKVIADEYSAMKDRKFNEKK